MQQQEENIERLLALDAAIFDLDGVLTRTAHLHADSWKRLFDGYFEKLRQQGKADAYDLRPFDIESDYLNHVDGKPRYNGVRDMLAERGIELPWGDPQQAPSDDPDEATVCSLGNRKNELFQVVLEERGVAVYDGGVALARAMRDKGGGIAVVSSSKNCRPILKQAGILDLFHSVVDGTDSVRLNLNGKPDPDIFLQAATELGVQPERAAIYEDAISGVQAGKAGGFAEVVGVNRMGEQHGKNLRENGATMVLEHLAP